MQFPLFIVIFLAMVYFGGSLLAADNRAEVAQEERQRRAGLCLCAFFPYFILEELEKNPCSDF
jgi:hypothetical protein